MNLTLVNNILGMELSIKNKNIRVKKGSQREYFKYFFHGQITFY